MIVIASASRLLYSGGDPFSPQFPICCVIHLLPLAPFRGKNSMGWELMRMKNFHIPVAIQVRARE